MGLLEFFLGTSLPIQSHTSTNGKDSNHPPSVLTKMFFKWTNPGLFMFNFRSFCTQFKYKLNKHRYLCRGIKPRAAVWQAQTDPLSHCGSPLTKMFFCLSNHFKVEIKVMSTLNDVSICSCLDLKLEQVFQEELNSRNFFSVIRVHVQNKRYRNLATMWKF